MTQAVSTDSREQVVDEIAASPSFILVTHENPDGDALGSLVAMQEILHRLGKDSVMFMAAEELPLPYEYRFFVLDGLVSVMPDDVEDRTIIFLDCGNIDRNPADKLKREGAHILNIDHHHDNTCFGTVNHIIPEASCTAEALYVGLVTDTGKFMYENTGTRAHVMAAELIEAGVDVHEIYRRLYEGIPYGKLELLARGLANIERYDDGHLTLTHLTERDYRETGAEENYSEGVVDHLRSVDGTAVAVLVRDRLAAGKQGRKKVSLRATDERIDVSRIARAQGGGGHRQAAGFSTEMPWDELIAFLRAEVAAQLREAA